MTESEILETWHRAEKSGELVPGGLNYEQFSWCMRVMVLRSMPYDEYLRTVHWGLVREEVMREARWVCICGERARDAHHVSYERIGYEQPGDVIALCRSCHERWHRTWIHRSRAAFAQEAA
jgi:hypothetical protein